MLSAQRAIHHFERADMLVGSIAVQRSLARLSMERGESRTANQLFQTLLEDLPSGRPETLTEAALSFFYAAENAYWQNDLTRARAYLEALLGLSEQLRDPALNYCAQIMGELYVEAGRSTEPLARQNYAYLEKASSSGEFERAIILDIRRLTAAGHMQQAWQAAQKLGIDLDDAADAYDHPMAILIPYLQATIARGKDLPAVTEPLAGALGHYAAMGRRLLELQLLVLLAWQRLKVEGDAAAKETLAEAARLAGETGYERPLLEIPELRDLLHELQPGKQTAVGPLSEREAEVLALLADGYSYREIGTALSVSINTVRSHVRQIYKKLAVHRRSDAIAAAPYPAKTSYS